MCLKIELLKWDACTHADIQNGSRRHRGGKQEMHYYLRKPSFDVLEETEAEKKQKNKNIFILKWNVRGDKHHEPFLIYYYVQQFDDHRI